MRPILALPTHGPKLRIVGDTIRVLATSADTGGRFEAFETTGPRDSGPPPHAHPWSESYFIAEGEVDVIVGDETMRARPGAFINIPAGTVHGYRIASDSARFTVITTSGGASEFFLELDAATEGSVADMDKIMAVAARHGLTVPPPR
jgi:quercetin dioxygenase-like cupin family protein